MDALIVRSLQGKASPDDEQRLRHWREADPKNEEYYSELRELWALLGLGASVAEQMPEPLDILDRAQLHPQESGAAESGRISGRQEPSAKTRSSTMRRRLRRGAIAAGLAAIGFGAVYGDLSFLGDSQPSLVHEVETGARELTTVTLSDGSSLRLGPSSWIRIYEQPGEQRLQLKGQAFFAAETTPSRALIVETELGQVVTLGTRFEVRAESGDLRVMVVDGRVAVSTADDDLEIGSGEMSRITPGDRLQKTRVNDVYRELDWMGNHLAFQATPLGDAVQEIEERFGVATMIREPALRDLPVTGTFTDQSPDVVIRVLCELARATCELNFDQVRIRS